MTDEELAAELTPDDPAIGARAILRMTDERKETYRRLVEMGRALNRHAAGLEPMPAGVIVTKATRRRTAP